MVRICTCHDDSNQIIVWYRAPSPAPQYTCTTLCLPSLFDWKRTILCPVELWISSCWFQAESCGNFSRQQFHWFSLDWTSYSLCNHGTNRWLYWWNFEVCFWCCVNYYTLSIWRMTSFQEMDWCPSNNLDNRDKRKEHFRESKRLA